MSFNQICKKAVETKLRLDDLERPHKLSASAFLRDAVSIAGTTDARLDLVEKALSRPEFRWSQQFYRTSMKFIREATCPRPPNDVRRISWLGKIAEVTAELSSIQSSPFELFALASRTITREHPEFFGGVDDWDAFQKHLADTKTELEKFYKEIEAAYSPSDLIIDNADKEGRARVSFRISHGAVHLGDGFPERLVTWLKENPNVKI